MPVQPGSDANPSISSVPLSSSVACLGAVRILALIGLVVLIGLPLTGAAQGLSPAQKMSVMDARQQALADQLILIDVRRPEEWAETGIADVATEIDMRAPDFVSRISGIRKANPGKPIAFICAVGSRSAALANWFGRRGFDNIVDVNAGMIGRNGWLANRLPVRRAAGAHPSDR